jgi:MFS family permease
VTGAGDEEQPARALALAVAAQTLGALPVFLTGALAPLALPELGMDAVGLGAAAGIFYAASAVGSALLGPLADTLGTWRATRSGLTITVLALGGIALFATSAASLSVFLVVAGLANGWIQPSTNLAVARFRWQGLGFGIKQSSIPIATLAAGFAVPAVGLTLGWRFAYGIGCALALALLLILPRGAAGARANAFPARRGREGSPLATLLVLGAMSGLGAGSANSMATFLVPSVTADGHSAAVGGLVVAFGSLVSVATRLAFGFWVDRRPFAPLPVVALLFLGGAAGYALLALGTGLGPVVVGTALGFGLGWGWSGLSLLAVVRANARSAGAATGITQAGVFTGAIFGPFLFGLVVAHGSYGAAWWTAAAMALAAAGCAFLGHRLLDRGAPPCPETGPA